MDLRYSVSYTRGTRKYMEDVIKNCYEDADFEEKTSFFAVFDGHGGKDAAVFAAENLWRNLKERDDFKSEDTNRVKTAIRNAFISIHESMWNEIDNWPKRKNGTRSTSGTTATVAIIRGRKMYVAQLGDSGLVLAKRNKGTERAEGTLVTPEHKPEAPEEKKRIDDLGGSVAEVKGVTRVVWKRPVMQNSVLQNGTLEKTTTYEHIPFLAVSRSLGDLWSYNEDNRQYIVSPEPDIQCYDIRQDEDWFAIIASDGLWGVVDAQEAVEIVHKYEKKDPDNPDAAANLISKALKKWKGKKMKADNISAITIFFDEKPHPGDNEYNVKTEDALLDESEETPPTFILSDVPPLKRSRGFRFNGLDEFKKFCAHEADCMEAAAFVEERMASDNGILTGLFSSEACCRTVQKRKTTGGTPAPKRSRSSSEGGSADDQMLVTNVSIKSLEELKMDNEVQVPKLPQMGKS